MRAGAPVIFQAAFLHDGWRGHADFLERVDDRPSSATGATRLLDTKLARSVKPYFVIQLCLYSELVAQHPGLGPERDPCRARQRRAPEPSRSPTSPPTTAACARTSRRSSPAGLPTPTRDPVPHCGLCRWSDVCDARRLADDHLSLVARLARPQIAQARGRGHHDGRRARARPSRRSSRRDRRGHLRAAAPAGAPAGRSARRRASRATSCSSRSSTPTKAGAGSRCCRGPREGDVFFDIEGDPFYEDGLEYLWGVTYLEDGEQRFQRVLGHATAPRRSGRSRSFIDFVVERRRRYPDLHVYHYAPYEPTAMKRLMGLHATREDEVDDAAAPERARRPLPRRRAGAADLAAELLDQEGRGVLHARARGDGHRRRGLDPEVRGVARRPASRRCWTAIEATTRRTATRRCCCATGCSSAARECERAVRRRDPVAPGRRRRAQRRPARGQRRGRRAPARPARRRARGPAERSTRRARALAAGAAARLPPPRGQAGLVGVLLALRADPRRSSSCATPRRSPGSRERRARARCPQPAQLADLHARASPPRSTRSRGQLQRPVHRRVDPETGELDPFSARVQRRARATTTTA